jgi:CheY-like chemotaxis protein
MATILIVEDEAIVALENSMNLKRAGHIVAAVVSTAKAAEEAFHAHFPDLILMDVKLKGDLDGIDAMNEIRKYSEVPVIFVTGNSDPLTQQRMRNISNASILLKPTVAKEIVTEVDKMLIQFKVLAEGGR